MVDYILIRNNQSIPWSVIPVLDYRDFLELNTELMQQREYHCVNYYGIPMGTQLKLICCMASDESAEIRLSSACLDPDHSKPLPSFTARHLSFHIFERELHENFGIAYEDHPWLKPLRYPFNRHDVEDRMENYPFYHIQNEKLHEVGVGPIHAGIIEPGHFRFICSGEQILHLETQLGYQHRGIETLFLQNKQLLQRTILAESIAGDTVAGHTGAFVNVWESMCGFGVAEEIIFARTLALEMERLAMHAGGLAGICADIGYQLGNAVFGRLRSLLINFMQQWCGNRLSKGLIRAGKNEYPLNPALFEKLTSLLDDFEPDFWEMYQKMEGLRTVRDRLEGTGIVNYGQAESIGMVGLAARASGIRRDIRHSHPSGLYALLGHQPVVQQGGDIHSRARMRKDETLQSVSYIRRWRKEFSFAGKQVPELKKPGAGLFAISLTEGWRGEICHCAVTDEMGELMHYKIKDPSMHNWLGVALAVRNNGISDFPICNKSFDLSYCGHDL